MDPISATLGIVGLGMSIFGGLSAASNAKQQAQVSMGIATDEGQMNAVKQQANTLSTSRAQLENVRNVQRVRAQGMNAAVSEGAQFGSGIQGAQSGATSQGAYNATGIAQQSQFANQMFGITGDIDQKKIQMAQLGGTAATDQGIASLGGALTKSAPMLGSLSKGTNFFGSSNG